MLIHCVSFSLVYFILFFFFLFRDLLETWVLDLLDHSVNGNDEVENEDQENDNLKENGVDVARSGHAGVSGQTGCVWKSLVCEGYHI